MVLHLIKEEMGRRLKGKQVEKLVNFSNIIDFVGNTNFASKCMPLTYETWILDTRASLQMSSNVELMQPLSSVNFPIKVDLPNVAFKLADKKGPANFHPN